MFVQDIYKNGDPSRVAFVGMGTITYGELAKKVELYRNTLYAMGIRQGDRVGLYSGNRPEFVYAYMAVVSLGAVIIPINCLLVDREVDFILKDSGACLLIADKPLTVSTEYVAIHDLNYKAEMENAPAAPDFPKDITEDDICTFVYTSGTTGKPKGAMLTHRNLVENTIQFNGTIPFTPDDNVLCVLPMFHCYGWTTALLAPLRNHSTVTILRTKSPSEIINAIVKYSVTIAFMVPPMYNLLARRGSPSDMATVRIFVSGGAAIPQPVAKAFEDRYGHPVVNGYGLTEASPVVAVLPPEKPKYLSVGPAIPGVSARITTADGVPYVAGTVGELCVSGANVMKGYWHRDEDTKNAFTEDGWLRTGDLAYMDDDGYIYIVDRIKDLIITNGENIYPGEVEDCIYEVEGVGECAVVGHPDPLRGQAVWAYIVMKDGYTYSEETIRRYLTQNLASYKIPRRFIPMDALPKNATGKILKRALREANQ